MNLEWGWGVKSGFFYVVINLLCLIWCYFCFFEIKDCIFGEIDMFFDVCVFVRKFKIIRVNCKLICFE